MKWGPLLIAGIVLYLVACGDDDDTYDEQGNWGSITDPSTGATFRCYADEYLSWCYSFERAVDLVND